MSDSGATREPSWGVVELIDQSAAVALEHASELQARLHSLSLRQRTADPRIDAAREQAHLLLVDIVSLRNAAELLKRELDQAV